MPASPPVAPSRVQSTGIGQGSFVLGLSVGLLAAFLIDRAARSVLDRDIELVREVRDLASEEFVREVAPDELIDDALGGMLSGLDRYSHYYGPDELAELERETSGEFLGIGVVFRGDELGRILFPYPGSPAAVAGLCVGDRIVTAAGKDVAAMSAREFQSLLHQGQGDLLLEVEGLDGTPREVSLRPAVVLDPTVRHARWLDVARGLGYLSIRSFSHRTPEEFDHAVQELGPDRLRGLVLDLRANPGGILDAAVSIANRFIDQGALVRTRTRVQLTTTEARRELATLAGLPLVVLVDRKSASASEVLGAALQDHCVAVLVGEPTYGKGTVQTLKRIGGERAVVKLTTATYFSPSLRRIEHDDQDASQNGIAPDLWLPIAEEERDEIHRFLFSDTPPAPAIEALHAWEEAEHVSLIEEPPADRQLDAALALLSGEELDLFAEPPR